MQHISRFVTSAPIFSKIQFLTKNAINRLCSKTYFKWGPNEMPTVDLCSQKLGWTGVAIVTCFYLLVITESF